MFAALNAVGLLRVSARRRDCWAWTVDQHGISAYPEYVISGSSTTMMSAHD